MKPRCSVFIATSLDGYIARRDGRIDWLLAANELMPPGEDCGYADFMATVDTLVMGRHSFEQVLELDPWPYGATPVIVLSRQRHALPSALPATVTVSRDSPAALVHRLGDEGRTHLYIDGGKTVQSFLAAGLIDDLTITMIPVLLGEGRPLFGALPADVDLRLESSVAYPFGFVQNRYRVQRTN